MLALYRSDVDREALARARKYLHELITSATNPPALSPFTLGALLYTWDTSPVPAILRFQARRALQALDGSAEEWISFFDYVQDSSSEISSNVARDYICFPKILPQSLLLEGLVKSARSPVRFRLARKRYVLFRTLHSFLRDREFYKHPGVIYASSVDQALIAFAFDTLRETAKARFALLYGLYAVYDNAVVKAVLNIGLPIALLLVAATAVVDVKTLALVFENTENAGPGAWLVRNDTVARIAGTILIWALAPVPGSVYHKIRARLWS